MAALEPLGQGELSTPSVSHPPSALVQVAGQVAAVAQLRYNKALAAQPVKAEAPGLAPLDNVQAVSCGR